MPVEAPLRVPVELVRQGERSRWFRLSTAVSSEAVTLSSLVPDELDGPLALAFHLPGDAQPIRCHGRAVETVVGEGEDERSERRAVRFIDLDEAARGRIMGYANERLGLNEWP